MDFTANHISRSQQFTRQRNGPITYLTSKFSSLYDRRLIELRRAYLWNIVVVGKYRLILLNIGETYGMCLYSRADWISQHHNLTIFHGSTEILVRINLTIFHGSAESWLGLQAANFEGEVQVLIAESIMRLPYLLEFNA